MTNVNTFLGISYQLLFGLAVAVIAYMVGRNSKNREAASRDQLTKVGNRNAGDKVLSDYERRRKRLSKRGTLRLALLMVDVDHFKRINDDFGHQAGDGVLEETGRLLQASCRPRTGDRVWRYGGEEFVLACPGVSDQEALSLAERLRARLETTIVYQGIPIPITASIGVALCARDVSVGASLEAADQALYEAKRAGRNQVKMAATSSAVGRTVMSK